MSKKVTTIVREVYDFLLEKNKELLLKEGNTIPTCYAISFDDKNNMSVMPIPLSNLNTADERRALMVEMSKIFKKEKIRVKMFMLITEAWMSKIDKKNANKTMPPSQDPNRTEALICSASDCYENARHQIFQINRDEDKKITGIIEEDVEFKSWYKQTKKSKFMTDTLLDSFWNEYRKAK